MWKTRIRLEKDPVTSERKCKFRGGIERSREPFAAERLSEFGLLGRTVLRVSRLELFSTRALCGLLLLVVLSGSSFFSGCATEVSDSSVVCVFSTREWPSRFECLSDPLRFASFSPDSSFLCKSKFLSFVK